MKRIILTIAILLIAVPALAQFKNVFNTAKSTDGYSTVKAAAYVQEGDPDISVRGNALWIGRSVLLFGSDIPTDIWCEPEIAGECFALEPNDQIVLKKWKLLAPKGDRLQIQVSKFKEVSP